MIGDVTPSDYFDQWFEIGINDLDVDSSVGKCQMKLYGSTIGVALGYTPETGFNQSRVAILKSMVRFRYDQLLSGQLISDPLNVFIKPEAHKIDKLRRERYRLISAVSLVDTMIDRVVFGPLQKRLLNTVFSTPCLVGWVPVSGGHHALRARFRHKKVLAVDKTAWDWTVKDWLVKGWAWFIRDMAVDPPPWWLLLVQARFAMLFRYCEFEFKDGSRVRQPGWGIMKSGCLLTLQLNSVGQSLFHYLAMMRMRRSPFDCQPICFGDDSIQELGFSVPEYIAHLELLGCLPKIESEGEEFDFVGWSFKRDWRIFPSYKRKHIFNILYGDEKTKYELLDALQYYYPHDLDMLRFIQRNLGVACPARVRPLRCLLSFMEGTPYP